MLKITFITGFVCFFYTISFGQSIPPTTSFWDNYQVYGYSIENSDLPDDEIFWVHEAEDGFIWLAHRAGLSKFDGLTFKNIYETGGAAYEIRVDSKGDYWIPSIGGGLHKYSNGEFFTYTEKNGLLSSIIKSIAIAKNDTIWVGNYGSGIQAFVKDTVVKTYTVDDGLINAGIWRLTVDSKNNLWIGTNDGLSILINGKFLNFSTQNGLPNNVIRGITEMSNGEVWVGTDGGGIIVFKNYTPFFFITKENGLSASFPQFFTENPIDHSILIANHGGGIDRYYEGSISTLNKSNQLISNYSTFIGISSNNLIWQASEEGLSVIKKRKINSITQKNGLPINRVVTVTATSDAIWFGTDGEGFSRFKNNEWLNIENPPNITNGYASSSTIDKDGNVWFGTQGSGIVKVENGTITENYKISDGLTDNFVRGLAVDSENNLWAGTNKGLNRIDAKSNTITTYSDQDSLIDDFHLTMISSSDGTIWGGTFEGGFYTIKNNKFSIFDTSNTPFTTNSFFSIYEDSEGIIWLANRSGIGRVKNDEFFNYTTDDGLYANGHNTIIDDHLGYLWLAFTGGIYRVKKEDFDLYDIGQIPSIPYSFYNKDDGIISLDVESANNSISTKTKSNQILLATTDGVLVIDPNKFIEPVEEIKAYIDYIEIEEDFVEGNESVILNPDQNKLYIHYSALNFLTPSKAKFRFKIDGITNGWVDAGNRKVAYFDY